MAFRGGRALPTAIIRSMNTPIIAACKAATKAEGIKKSRGHIRKALATGGQSALGCEFPLQTRFRTQSSE